MCNLDISKFKACTHEHGYGYNNSAPCIFLKLNRIFGWVPDYYNDPEDLPTEMPASLKDYIKGLNASERNQVWISCQGEDGSDKELLSEADYFPTRGFPSYYYPYTNLKGYVSPLVAVKFLRPKSEFFLNNFF